MDILRQHEIAEAGHRILNPLTDDKLMLLGEVCRLAPGQRHLDLACGKGEMLARWADMYGTLGDGIDISEVFLAAAHERARELGVSDRVTFRLGDAAKDVPADASYDLVSCIGATWIGGGLAGTVELMRPALRPGGLLLIGEPYWTATPPDGIPAHLAEFTSLEGTLDRLEAAGLGLVEMVLADRDSWDRYMAAQWWTVDAWLREHPSHPDAGTMRGYLDESRRTHLRYQREFLGWGVFVCRDGQPRSEVSGDST
ncbi:methyltransferase domain-containing protein [Dactylosporangium aurantiacum]|uniref:Methyltransferase domain-containing protein n=1 Tax=Dactylosporangium aurantiacum TaxID=35754 RepID=A0A9Q9I9Y5_9ACTN|nr:class I SAM-dependent methyltransferase [Dactylosporangium aurantiacum]MDG6109305.1 class I SAM-dependent methyltransferase [Dactylosporangium aurantiacum]UWZ50388.1 methyltransferase domain-containing protein [Dactylosporangium aurantiacum]